MLTIALQRTRSGSISMRLKTVSYSGCDNQALLEIQMEDSGPHVQPGQLLDWLQSNDDPALNEVNSTALSWCIMTNVAKILHCTLSAKSTHAGMVVEGKVPLEMVSSNVIEFLKPAESAIFSYKRIKAPLVLVVEDNAKERNNTIRLFAQAGCRTFIVDNHEQGLAWASVLPFSAIVLNMSLPDAGNHVPRKLYTLIQQGIMADIPFWAMFARNAFMEFDQWHAAGISELLVKPLRLDILQPLCAQLTVQDTDFYHRRDTRTSEEMPAALKEKMGELHLQLNEQIVPIEAIAEKFAQGNYTNSSMYEAHAVKSAALSLGYFRLAGCMGEIENAIVNHRMPAVSENWMVIAECLKAARF